MIISPRRSSTAPAAAQLHCGTDRRRPGWRPRALVLLASVVAGLGFTIATPGIASAASGTPDCIHGVYGYTDLTTSLPLYDARTAGSVERAWLYHWNGRAWTYTGRYTGARAYAGGVWRHNGHVVDEIAFHLRPGSGYYVVREQIVAHGQNLVFFQPLYRNVPGSGYTRWCQA